MAEEKASINVTPPSQYGMSINVSTSENNQIDFVHNKQNIDITTSSPNYMPLNATPDLSMYYSEVSEDWAKQAENSAERAAQSATTAKDASDSILNNPEVQEVLNNLKIIEAAPENAQIAQEQATLAKSYSDLANESATLASQKADVATEQANVILGQVVNAETYANNANVSANSAKTSADNAQTFANNAKTSETNAKASETSAKQSASEALNSKNSASASATSASTSASTATTKASEAKTSATQAANSATSASNSATQAQGYAQDALNSKNQAQDIVEQGIEDIQEILENASGGGGGSIDESNLVHKDGAETITGAKTFTGAVNLIGSGDSNAVGISTNTRFNVHNTTQTVLGFGSGLFYINHGNYRLRLRGKDTRPHYNSDTNYLALLSDVPDTSNLATKSELEQKQDTLTAGENITIENGVISASSGSVDAYTKSETDALLDKKQDVLSATEPLEIAFKTVGGPYNVNVINDHLYATYGGYPLTSRGTSGVSLSAKSATFPGFDDNDLVGSVFKGECSYFDVPIDMAVQMQKVDNGEQSKAEYEISVGGFQNTSNKIVFLAGNISDTGFEPIIYARPLNSTSSQYVLGLLDGTVSISSANMLTLNAYGSITSAMSNGSTDTRPPSYNLLLRYDINQPYPYYINTKCYTGSNYLVAYKRTSTDTVFMEKLRKVNVVRVFWDYSYTSGEAYTPTVEQTIVTLNSVDTGWRITDGAVTTYGVSLNYDNTLKVNDNGELGANLIAGENITIEDNVISAVVPEGGGLGMPIGTIYPLSCSPNYVPEGSLPCDGAEYTKSQFSGLWDDYLTGEEETYYAYYAEETYGGGELTLYTTTPSPTIGDEIYQYVDGEMTSYPLNYVSSIDANYIVLADDITAYATLKRDSSKDISTYNSLLNTCTYSEYEADIATYGQCAKFAVDTANETFRVPLIKDGAVIQQAMSNGELGKSYNAGLPNIEGEFGGAELQFTPASGAFYQIGTEKGSAQDGTDFAVGFDASRSNPIYGNSDTVQPNAVALRYFVVVANGSINQSMMDWSQWASNLQGKLNADHSNDTKPYIVETYVNGTSWYRVYSDGWCEQGGVATGASNNTGNAVTFMKTYANTNYTLQTSGLTRQANTFANATGLWVKVRNLTVTGFSACTGYTSTGNAYEFSWEAKGYIS